MPGAADDLVGGAVLDDHAAVHEDDPVGDLAGEGHLVGDDHHRHALLGEPAHHREDVPDQLGVERGGRLVEEHHLGAHGERPRDGHPLLLAAGQGGRVGVRLLRQADAAEVLGGGLRRARPVPLEDPPLGQREVLGDAQVREEVELLEDHADAAAYGVDVDVGVGHLGAADEDLALGGLLQQVDAAQQGRLAGTGGADDADDLALADLQVDAAQDVVVPEGLVQVAYLDLRAAHRIASWDLDSMRRTTKLSGIVTSR